MAKLFEPGGRLKKSGGAVQIDLSQFHPIFRGEAEMLLARIVASQCSRDTQKIDHGLTGAVLLRARLRKGGDDLTRFVGPAARGASLRCQEALR